MFRASGSSAVVTVCIEVPFGSVSVQPSRGLPTTTMWPMFGSGLLAYNEMSGLLTFIKTQTMVAAECENATGFRSPLS